MAEAESKVRGLVTPVGFGHWPAIFSTVCLIRRSAPFSGQLKTRQNKPKYYLHELHEDLYRFPTAESYQQCWSVQARGQLALSMTSQRDDFQSVQTLSLKATCCCCCYYYWYYWCCSVGEAEQVQARRRTAPGLESGEFDFG